MTNQAETHTARRIASSPRRRGLVAVLLHTALPALVGIAAAVLLGGDAGLPSAIMLCAAIYLASAVIGRPWSAWLALLGFVPLMALGVIFDSEWPALIGLGLAQLVFFGIGAFRGTWGRRENLAQVWAALACAGLAVVAAAGAPLPAGIALVVGLAGHGVWDIIHHRAEIIVSRSYSAFCAGLDFALAAVVTVALVGGP